MGYWQPDKKINETEYIEYSKINLQKKIKIKINLHIQGHLIYDKGAKEIQYRKDSFFNKLC